MSNRLASETSPYLRQHASNPVDWWPWCDAALDAARTQGKPILLSIGYSACHWCHVMAHESFEDAATAALMNEYYICIKVDREERPDLDKIYQLAHQALTRRGGGWPLTVFLTPDDHLPFFAGTYFPKTPRYGMPDFAQVLREVRRWWETQREQVRAQNSALAEFLASQGRDAATTDSLSDAPMRSALAQIDATFDAQHGGQRGAPKFPHTTQMELELDLGIVERVKFTLARMADGGIHDQLGGGFARYSVDERWEIPHFEKMLNDNALLLPLYAQCDRGDVAQGIVDWLAREITAPSGGFYAALDADSEHEEGKFYVWSRDELRSLLDADEYAVVAPHYGLDRAPNFEDSAWNPIIAMPLDAVARSLDIAHADAAARLASARAKLFAARAKRIRPGLDDKILTAWNALAIGGLARTSRALARADWLAMAERAANHLHDAAWRDGRLFAKTGPDAARFPGFLDDYAFVLDALLELLQCRWLARDSAWAVALADALLEHFEDRELGGFFFTAHDHEALIQRSKPWTDEATPSGNGVAARALLRLGHLVGETRYQDAAERCLRAGWSTLQQIPHACCAILRALNDFLHPRTHIVIRYGDAREESAWRSALTHTDRRTDVYFIPAQAHDLPGLLAAQKYAPGGLAYVCRGTQCEAPISDPDRLRLNPKR